jgi:hypothetical protein
LWPRLDSITGLKANSRQQCKHLLEGRREGREKKSKKLDKKDSF